MNHQHQAEHVAQCVLKAIMPHINRLVDALKVHNLRISRLEGGLDQVEVGLLVDKVTVLEARLRDMEYELGRLRQKDENVPSPWI